MKNTRVPLHINTLLLTDEELKALSFNNQDGLYFSVRHINDHNEVRIYVPIDNN